MKKILRALAAAGLAAGACVSQASTVVVYPGDVANAPVLNQWYLTNFRDVSTGFTSNTTAAVTGTQARNGNGSVQMSLTNGTGKADYAYSWGFVAGRTLGSLNTLSYDWYRSGSSTNPAGQQPAFRLLYDADGNAATTADQGYLIWEQIYNGLNGANNGNVPTNQWVSSDLMGGDFWQRQFSPGNTVENFDTDLQEWIAGAQPSAVADILSGNTAILGIEFGIGSGWNGAFEGFVDNVSFRFGTAEVSNFNFELRQNNVPEPGGVALAGLALFALLATRRRR